MILRAFKREVTTKRLDGKEFDIVYEQVQNRRDCLEYIRDRIPEKAPLTNCEKHALEFDQLLLDLESISFKSSKNENENFHITIKDESTYNTSLIDELRKLHMGEWKGRYVDKKFQTDYSKNDEWEIILLFGNGKKKRFSGIDVYPWNFREFIKTITQSRF